MRLNFPLGTTLGKDICFECWIKEAAEATWAATGHHVPQVVFRKKGRVGIVAIASFSTPEDKAETFSLIRNLTRDCDTVAFIAEAWLTKSPDKPREREGLIISLYQLAREPESWVALIDPATRKLQLPWVKSSPYVYANPNQ